MSLAGYLSQRETFIYYCTSIRLCIGGQAALASAGMYVCVYVCVCMCLLYLLYSITPVLSVMTSTSDSLVFHSQLTLATLPKETASGTFLSLWHPCMDVLTACCWYLGDLYCGRVATRVINGRDESFLHNEVSLLDSSLFSREKNV